jgi:hypothetical protein
MFCFKISSDQIRFNYNKSNEKGTKPFISWHHFVCNSFISFPLSFFSKSNTIDILEIMKRLVVFEGENGSILQQDERGKLFHQKHTNMFRLASC